MQYKNFRDFISVTPVQVPKEIKVKYIDKILKDIDRQKEEGVDEIQGLQVKIRATHSARLTGHDHFYVPSKVSSGVSSFTDPYKKPILVNHDLDSDPIGRVQSARYISTPHPLIPASLYDSANNVKYLNAKNLGWVDKLDKFLLDRSFEGLGYVSLVGNITDPEAVIKALDGRYLTVSVGYDTTNLFCSICKQDWLKDGPCKHEKSRSYKDRRMFFIFGDMIYGEVSYVNEPADELAQNEEVKKILVPLGSLKDSLRGTKSKSKKIELIKNAYQIDSNLQPESNRIVATMPSFYMFDSVTHDVIPLFSELSTDNNAGDTMLVKDLLALNTTDVYQKLAELLPQDKVLKPEELEKLTDADFIGNRLFPVVDQVHIDACKKLLEGYEDSDEKTELVSFLDTRALAMHNQSASQETPETTTETTVDETTETTVETNDSNISASGNDFITYSFKLEANQWGLPDTENPDTDKEKQILEFLLSLYAKEKSDALNVINKVFAIVGDAKESLVAELLSTDQKVKEVQVGHDTLKKEYQLLKDSLVESNKTITTLTNELKDKYVSDILSFTDTKINPDDPKAKKEFFKDKSLKEIKTALEVLKMVDDNTTDSTETTTKVDNKTLKFDATLSDEQIKAMKDKIEAEFEIYKSVLGQDVAKIRRNTSLTRLQKLIDKSNK